MKPKVYLETSILGCLTAWIARDLVSASNQAVTREWWATREDIDLYGSAIVIDESGRGDPEASRHRLELISDIPQLEINDAARMLGKKLVRELSLPSKASADALHISLAASHGMNYLLT
ncbi:MAG: type II toxin-antitoxin system VapC family toxin [Pirellulales bacterium]|nr:type II toxin-antitoxin system VapC family toxin [Pirellulales bacterium]